MGLAIGAFAMIVGYIAGTPEALIVLLALGLAALVVTVYLDRKGS